MKQTKIINRSIKQALARLIAQIINQVNKETIEGAQDAPTTARTYT